jgi:hypothetical protein
VKKERDRQTERKTYLKDEKNDISEQHVMEE